MQYGTATFKLYHGQLVSAAVVDPERSGATSDWHQTMRPHLTSSVTFALVASEATGLLQTGYIGLQIAAQRNPFVPRGWLRAHCWLRTPSSALGRRQRAHCSANLHSARRQKIFGDGTETMEQSSRHTAKIEHWICAVQTTFKGISVWRDCGALATFCL